MADKCAGDKISLLELNHIMIWIKVAYGKWMKVLLLILVLPRVISCLQPRNHVHNKIMGKHEELHGLRKLRSYLKLYLKWISFINIKRRLQFTCSKTCPCTFFIVKDKVQTFKMQKSETWKIEPWNILNHSLI